MAVVGWGESDYKKGELGYILDGNLPNKCKLDDCISLKTPGSRQTPALHMQSTACDWWFHVTQPLMSHTWLASGRCASLPETEVNIMPR